MKVELYLLIIWKRAENLTERILDDSRSKLEIVKIIERTWDKSCFCQNITRFYGTKLPCYFGKARDFEKISVFLSNKRI